MSRALQKTIHVGCRELGIDADTRRELQKVITGKASMSDMDTSELLSVVKALRDRGFQRAQTPQRYARASRADLRLVHVLWAKLGEAGVLDKPGRAGLNAFIRSQFGNVWASVPVDVDALRDDTQINAVISALKSWCARAGVPLHKQV